MNELAGLVKESLDLLEIMDSEIWAEGVRQAAHGGVVTIKALRNELNSCRNELCLRCGEYKRAYLGACDGCRWKEVV